MTDRGFTLIEAVTALALLCAASLSVAQMAVVTGTRMHAARLQTMAVALAASRMEELRSLTWAFDGNGVPLTDASTNLATERPTAGGAGLSPSPPGSLDSSSSGYVDFLNAAGAWISAGPAAPRDAVFVRRWAVEAPADGSPDSLVIQVVVRPVVEDNMHTGRRPSTARIEARLVTLHTRTAR